MKSVIQSVTLIGHTLPFHYREKDRGVGRDGELPNVTAVLQRFALLIRSNIFQTQNLTYRGYLIIAAIQRVLQLKFVGECSCRLVRISWAERTFCLVKFLGYFTKLFQIQ